MSNPTWNPNFEGLASLERLMNVLLSTSTYPLPNVQGLPRFVHDLASALAEIDGVRVSVLAPGFPGAPTVELHGRLRVHRFSYFWPRKVQNLAYGHGMTGNLRNPATLLQILPFLVLQTLAIKRIVREREIDVVNSHWALPQGLTSAIARRGEPFPHVLTLHGGDVHLLRRLPFGERIARFIVRRTDALLPVGQHLVDLLTGLVGEVPSYRIRPMGVDPGLFGKTVPLEEPPFGGDFLLFVGRLLPIKGVDRLLEALALARQHRPETTLVVVGYGQSEADLKKTCGDLGLSQHVRFIGRQSHDQVAQWIASSRAVVVPSIRNPSGVTEGTPTVVLEALASGRPVVASRVGGIPDLIRSGHNGWLCEPGNVEDLCSKMLLAYSAADRRMERQARITAEEQSWDNVAAMYHEVLLEAMSQHRQC